MEKLHQQIAEGNFQITELSEQNAALKAQMSSREAAWQKEKEIMQGTESERLREELKTEIKVVKKELRLQQKDFISLSTRFQSQEEETQKITQELRQKCNQVKEMESAVHERDQVIGRVTCEKMALDERNKELTATVTKVLQKETECQSEINALKDNLRREQVKKEAGFDRIKELERLVKAKKENWVSKHDSINLQKDQMIATSKMMAMGDSNRDLQAIKTVTLQNKTGWEPMWDLWRKISDVSRWRWWVRKNHDFEDAINLVNVSAQTWEAKHQEDVKLRNPKYTELQLTSAPLVWN